MAHTFVQSQIQKSFWRPITQDKNLHFKQQTGETGTQVQFKITSILNEVSRMINRLLQNIGYLYETNGICYSTSEHYHTLFKLLTPYELLSFFHISDCSQLFWGTELEKQNISKCRYQRQLQSKNKNKNKAKGGKKNQQDIKVKNQQIQWYEQPKKNINSQLKQKMQNFQQKVTNTVQQIQKAQQQPNRINNRNRPILSAEIQKQLIKWVIQQLVTRRHLKLREIAKHAKQLAHNVEGFRSSRGWVTRFLMRHSYLREMITQSKANNMDMVKAMYLKIKDKLFQNQKSPGSKGEQQQQKQSKKNKSQNKQFPDKNSKNIKINQEQAKDSEQSEQLSDSEYLNEYNNYQQNEGQQQQQQQYQGQNQDGSLYKNAGYRQMQQSQQKQQQQQQQQMVSGSLEIEILSD